MWVIEVIPIRRGIGIETLSYFTNTEIEPGALVRISIRGKNIFAITVSATSVAELKSELKKADYQIKKIDKIEKADFLSKEFVKASEKSADFFASKTGSLLFSLLPITSLPDIQKVKINYDRSVAKVKTGQQTDKKEKIAIQGDDEDRYASYRSTIRQEFARKSSVVILAPTIEYVNHIKTVLNKGIEDYTIILHNSLSKKDLAKSLEKIESEKHPLLIITTPSYLFLTRNDVSTLIIEQASSRYYKSSYRPYADIRIFAEYFAKELNINLILGDLVLPTELLYRESINEFQKGEPLKWRTLTTANVHIVDMSTKKDKNTGNSAEGNLERKDSITLEEIYKRTEKEKKIFQIFSPALLSLVLKNKEENERMIMLVGRKGLAPQTICSDCQNVVLCKNCSAPVVLYPSLTNPEKNFFMCRHCGERRSALETCEKCGSWNLKTLGIGIDFVHKNLLGKYPDLKIIKIDKESCPTDKKAHESIELFLKSPGSILLGTEMALQYIHEKVENSAIVSLDSLLSLPDFRIHEKLFYNIVSLRAKTYKAMVIQTRQNDLPIFEYGAKGNILEFYKTELENRKITDYPPFSILIKITLRGKKENIVSEMEMVQKALEPEHIDIFPSFTHTVNGEFILHGLLKIPREKWLSDKKMKNKNTNDGNNVREIDNYISLLEKIKGLPLSAEIRVDPESLL
ncbi:MAG: hypothetical protein Q7R78_00170 [bacterium]|nr:hypothetical protein [bacterium]